MCLNPCLAQGANHSAHELPVMDGIVSDRDLPVRPKKLRHKHAVCRVSFPPEHVAVFNPHVPYGESAAGLRKRERSISQSFVDKLSFFRLDENVNLPDRIRDPNAYAFKNIHAANYVTGGGSTVVPHRKLNTQLAFINVLGVAPIASGRAHKDSLEVDFSATIQVSSFSIFSGLGSSIIGVESSFKPNQTYSKKYGLGESKENQVFGGTPHTLLSSNIGVLILKIFKGSLAACFVFVGCSFGVWLFTVAMRSETLLGSITFVSIGYISIILALKWASAWYSP